MPMIHVRVDEETHSRLRFLATQRQQTMQALMLSIIDEKFLAMERAARAVATQEYDAADPRRYQGKQFPLGPSKRG